MEEFAARLAALEHGVRERDVHFQHLKRALSQQQTVLQAQQAQSSETPFSQPDLHCELLARVKEFDGYGEKWTGWCTEKRGFCSCRHGTKTQICSQCADQGFFTYVRFASAFV